MDPSVRSILTRPGSIVFPANRSYVPDPQRAGGRVVRQPSGHLIFYDRHGRRFLATDPGGVPLHECEWAVGPDGEARLLHARLQLDWGQWVGLRPEGMVHETTLDLSRKPGWQRLRADDLRRMAAHALQVPLPEVQFFYGDQDLVLEPDGHARIRHRKDVFSVLEDGTFARSRFMSCMGAMHWAQIDFLPVVELFQSLLPGTGSAAFELIRGLYDDQAAGAPRPLRYRGIPTYPSEAAFRLFSSFFTPQGPGGADPLALFMDPPRSHTVLWLPAPAPPRRYFDPDRRLCVTIQGEAVTKATMADDTAGLSYGRPGRGGVRVADRSLRVQQGRLVLRDGDRRSEVPIDPHWGPIEDSPAGEPSAAPISWRALFMGPAPSPAPSEAFGAVLLYLDDDAEIDEYATQPFVADFLEDRFDQDPALAKRVVGADRVLIDGFDAVAATFVRPDRPRQYRIVYTHPAFAQRQAQAIWTRLAAVQRWDWLKGIALTAQATDPTDSYDLIFQWVPFASFARPSKEQEIAGRLRAALAPGGIAFVVGSAALRSVVQAFGLLVKGAEAVESLPTFQMHRTILPQARLAPDLFLYQLARSPERGPSRLDTVGATR